MAKNSDKAAETQAIDTEAVRKKIVQIRTDLAAVYRERDAAIECITLAALSNAHALLVGPPGTGKSALFYGFLASFVDARKFLTLITKFGTEDEVFGPVKLSALKADRWERNLDGRLAAVECAFLDEVFKGSDSVLNAMLSAMNERVYKGQPIPLRLVVGASNELPSEEILAAVYDRFLLRDVVEYVAADATWMSLVASPPSYTPRVSLTLAEWDAALSAARSIPLGERVIREMLRVKTELGKLGVVASDRRWIALTSVMRAAAWLDGEVEVTLDQMAVLAYGLWQKPADRATVKSVLDKIDGSAVKQSAAIIDEALRVFANRTTDPARRRAELPQVQEALADAAKRVSALLKSGLTKRALERIQPKLKEVDEANTTIKREMRDAYEL